ncbi:MAG TPA: transglycosylase SLT domain-containing protein [Bacteroidales bacterium]|nr:transglycosylase SLT domain-containing protein [Bacteroidales bacterium]HQG36459.1 transglycosylase SLT domain-containing protein [Bacteroidales bacterium]HQG52538.1 transglycosylase SLT domain-containing protein [Bacteroidales bacterium]HQJ21457.1 transglycosylase SLT domain-containing protein [Bacteroidales bacterium]
MAQRIIIVIMVILQSIVVEAKMINDTIILRPDNTEMDRVEKDLDSLLNEWYVKLSITNAPADTTAQVIPEFPDSVYAERLSKINSVINLNYNNIIRAHIHVYTDRKREILRAIIGLSDYYFPMIEDIFESYSLPSELKYMAVIESALNPNAVSRAGATGLWQFLSSTGRMYGLTINSIVDERRDPVKSTHAAARYIKDLYNIFDDWVLVIAAYNCGPGNVTKAIARSGNRRDYWEIYYRLPRETRGYIPQFVAATYALNYYREHNISPLTINIPVATDTILFNKDIHLAQISEVMNIPYGELRALNPQYRTGFIPGASKPYPITLPVTRLRDFILLTDSIRNYKADYYLKKNGANVNPVYSSYSPVNIAGKTRLYYTVKDGDNLGYISEWYRVRLSDLRYWNDIYTNTIRVGQRITVFVDPDKADYFSKINNMSFAEKQALRGKPVTVNKTADSSSNGSEGEYTIYTVQRGDTIWDIVKKFDGVTVSDVLALNNIDNPSKIQEGQKLKIRKKTE